MKNKIYICLTIGFLFLFNNITYAKQISSEKDVMSSPVKLNSFHTGIETGKASISKRKLDSDSLPVGFNDKEMKTLLDENGNKLIPDDEIDAFQQRSFTGFASGDIYGYSLSSAGDVNGDGYDDLIMGAPQNNSAGVYAGRAYIYYGGISVNGIPDVILSGESANNFFGISVSKAGDINEDGYSDVIVGAQGYNLNTGRAYIYFGGASMNNVADVTLDGEGAENYFGISVSESGDVNGDGYPDILIGAYGYNSYTGRSYIFFGDPLMDNVPDVIFTGENTDDLFSESVSAAGDINADGYADIIIGAEGFAAYTGKAYVYFGDPNMDAAEDISMTGEDIDNNFGLSVSSAGDVNGDGYSDLIIGAPGYNNNDGRSYIYLGGIYADGVADLVITGTVFSGLGNSVSSAGDVNGDGFSDIIVGAYSYNSFTGRAYVYFGGVSMNDTADLTFTGESYSFYFGSAVSDAGDVNGDGYADVIIDAYGYNGLTGKAYLNMYGMNGTFESELSMSGTSILNLFGNSIASAGDVNGDGYSDLIVGSPTVLSFPGNAFIYFGGPGMDNVADVTLTGEGNGNRLGQSVSGAGDVNGDGYADVIVGASGYNSSVGRAYVFYGGAVMNNVPDVIMTGELGPYYFGDAVAGAGDVNGDGYADVIIGADGYNSQTGRTYVYYGGAAMNNTADVIMTGEGVSNWFGQSISTAGDINNDGYSDVIIGAYGYSSNTGRVYIYYGGDGVMNADADIKITGGAANDRFGNSVKNSGDLNGDGISDIAVGSPGYNLNTGRVFIYFGGTGIGISPGVIMNGESISSYFGSSVSSAGDINADGYSDLIVGAAGGSTFTGKAFVFYGGAVMNNSTDVTLTGTVINTSFGNSVASADLNGDSSPDLIVGNVGFNSSTGKIFVYFTSSPNVHPNILSVNDIPGDQGSYVYLKWAKSAYDVLVNGLVTNYLVERSDPPGSSGYQWISVGTVPSTQNAFYQYEARTASDNASFFFRVTALTNNVSEKWRSNILSGVSIDNLAPLPPANLSATLSGNDASLNWDRNPETDLRQYIIYRNDIQIGTSATLYFTDASVSADSDYVYTIAAEDIHGNISGLSNPASVNPVTANVDIKMIPQGFYNSVTKELNMSDTMKTYLHSINSPYTVIDSASSIIDSVTFTGTFKFPNAPTGTYYIDIRHRNSIETWSKAGGESIISGNTVSYDFTNSVSKAFGNNMKQIDASPLRFGIFSGDVNGDGLVDLADVVKVYNGTAAFLTGYVLTDITGDRIVDLSDLVLTYNNANSFAGVIRP